MVIIAISADANMISEAFRLARLARDWEGFTIGKHFSEKERFREVAYLADLIIVYKCLTA